MGTTKKIKEKNYKNIDKISEAEIIDSQEKFKKKWDDKREDLRNKRHLRNK